MSKVTHRRFDLLSRDGEKLRADIRFVSSDYKKPVLLFLHGFKGFKDWGPFPYVLAKLAGQGFVTIAFNFSHNGIGNDLQTFTELDRFAENTLTLELDEVEDVLRVIISQKNIPIEAREIDSSKIGLIGHSRGAGLAIIAGADSNYAGAVAALSSVSKYDRYSERQKEKWRRVGKFEIMNARTKQVMRLNASFLDDLERNADRLDILSAAQRIAEQGKPLLIVTGSEDLVTPPREAERIAEAANGPKTTLKIIPKASHTFNTAHPFISPTDQIEEAIQLCADFMRKQLMKGDSEARTTIRN